MLKKLQLFLTKRTLPVSLFIAIISIYQATFLNSTYYRQVWQQIMINNIEDLLFFCSMPIVVFCTITVILNLLIFPKLIKLVASVLVIVSAFVNYFMSTYRIMVDRDMLQNALDTNRAESLSLLTPDLIIYVVLFAFIPVLLIICIRIKPIKNKVYYLLCRLLTVIIATIIILIIAIFFYKNYATFTRNNSGIIKYLTPSNYITAIYNQYDYLKYKNLPFIELGDDAHQQPPANANGKKSVIILIVGETARSQNFSLGNYNKETNNQLAKQDVIYFRNTSSCGTSTAYSLPCMFSNMPREAYEPKLVNKQSNVLDILQKAGVNILWVDNDSGCKGVCDRVPSIDITKKYQNNSKLCQGDNCYDDILLTDLPEYLENIQSDTLIILHTIGSHGPTYYQRYPDQYRKFTPTCDTNEINRCSQEELINTYDNTIVYTDAVINKAINLLKSDNERYNTALMYISDHGESLGENNIYLHAMPYTIAPAQQTSIPLLVWLSDKYQKQQSIDTMCLKTDAKQQMFSQDNLFHSLLGMFNISTTEYQSELDILKSCQTTSRNHEIK